MERAQALTFQIGDWRAVQSLNLLERRGQSVQIEPRAMDVLTYLARHGGEVVSVNELIEVIWKNHVSEGAVYRVINQLRHVLDDGGTESRYIQTIPKRGYRLIAEVNFDLAPASNTANEQRLRGGEIVSASSLIRPWSREGGLKTATYVFAPVLILTLIGLTLADGILSERQTLGNEFLTANYLPSKSEKANEVFIRSHVAGLSNAERLQLLDEVIELDPNFAEAYAEKAYWYAGEALSADHTEASLAEVERQVREYSDRAISLDPNFGRAYAATARFHALRRRWDDASADFERALQLSPNDPILLLVHSQFDSSMGEFEPAIRKLETVLHLDPDNPDVMRLLGQAYLFAKKPDAAVPALLRAIWQSSEPNTYTLLGLSEAMRGNDTEALKSFQFAEELGGGRPDPGAGFFARTAYGYGQIGRPGDAARLLNFLEELALSGQRVEPVQLALASLAAGNYQASLDWFDEAIEKQDRAAGGLWITAVVVQNVFEDPVLEQPEFIEIRKRLDPKS